MTTGVTCLRVAWSLATWTRTKTMGCTSAQPSTHGGPSPAAEPASDLHVSDPAIMFSTQLWDRVITFWHLFVCPAYQIKSVCYVSAVVTYTFLEFMIPISHSHSLQIDFQDGKCNGMKCQKENWKRERARESGWEGLNCTCTPLILISGSHSDSLFAQAELPHSLQIDTPMWSRL